MRGVVKLPHTPRRRLGVTAHRQAEYACGGPADAEPTFGGAPAIPLDDAFNALGKFEPGRDNMFNRLVEAWASALGLSVEAVSGLVEIPPNPGFGEQWNSKRT
ncbi:MAG: hypothetical protein QOI97_5356 [Pseudomonas sp.]|nr:hypothetical protein [Pseudomonas sp.]